MLDIACRPSAEAAEAPRTSSSTCTPGLSACGRPVRGLAAISRESEEHHMYATVHRYEGIDKVCSDEITRKVGDSLLPALRKLPGFAGYYLIDAGDGVFTSIGLFENSKQAHESTRIAA